MTISVRFVWGSEGVPFTFSPEQDSCKRKWGTGDTIGRIRKLKYFLSMNTFCVVSLVKENEDTIDMIRKLKSFIC